MEYRVFYPISIWENFMKADKGLATSRHNPYLKTIKQAVREFDYLCQLGFKEVRVYRIRKGKESIILESINRRER